MYNFWEQLLLYFSGGAPQTFEHATSGKEDWSQAFTSDGQLWACQKHDRSVLVYDFATATELHVFNGHTSTICGLLFSPNNELLATAGHYISAGRIDETVRLWDIQSGEQRHILRPGPQYMPMAITFSPDSKLLAVSYFVDTIGEIYLFDVQTGQKTQILKGHSRPVHYLKFSHDGTHLATASWDDSFRLWNTATGQEVHRWNHQEDLKGFFVGLMCNSDETLLISGIRERGMVFLNPDSGQIESSIPVPDLLHFDLSSDGQLLATGGWESIQLWQV